MSREWQKQIKLRKAIAKFMYTYDQFAIQNKKLKQLISSQKYTRDDVVKEIMRQAGGNLETLKIMESSFF